MSERREPLLFLLHLAPDRIGLLGTAIDVGGNTRLVHLVVHINGNLFNHIAGFTLQGDETADDRIAPLGVEHAERQIFQFFAHPLHTHATGQRRVDIHRLAGLLGLLVVAHGFDGAHVVQTVGQLDQRDTQITAGGHEQFAEILGLFCLGRIQLQVCQLGDAVHKVSDLAAKAVFDLGEGRFGVFDGVMQQGCDQRCVIHLLLGKDACNRDRMGEIRLSGMAKLPLVHLGTKGKRITEHIRIGFWIIGANQRDQVFGGDHAGSSNLISGLGLPSKREAVSLRSGRLRQVCLPRRSRRP